MKFEKLQSDTTILTELGSRLAKRRIEFQLTQAQLAKEAGISKRTVERVEAGATTQSSSLIRILRVLDLVERLEVLLPETGPRPIDLMKLKGKERQRATGKKKPVGRVEWTWGDE